MPQYVEFNGQTVEFPDGMAAGEIERVLRNHAMGPRQSAPARSEAAQHAGNLLAGAVRGAGSIGATLMTPIDAAARTLGIENSLIGRRDRREAMDSALGQMGAETDSWMYQGGKLGAEIAGTAGAGAALAGGARALGASAPVVDALATGGFRVGQAAGTRAALPLRALGGAAGGGAAAGLVDPEYAATGALLGGATPVAVQAAGATGRGIGRALSGGSVAPEVRQLAQRADALGIQVPADRLVGSRPLNAIASSLEYVPLSGRAASVERMNSQLNTAVSRTIGQDTSNVTQALRSAEKALGGEFDRVLRSNTVNIDQQFMQELADAGTTAARELGQDGQRIIENQISELLTKGANGQIDGQAAYNIKRTLDRIGRRNTPEAWHANEMRRSLMGALERSIGPQEAAQFAQTRQQYGNMLSLQRLAPNGAEGEISAARLANMRDVRSPDLQELADIAAQFVKPREGAHSAQQRAWLGGLGLGGPAATAFASTGSLAAPIAAIGALGAGRMTNSLLNSTAVRNSLLGLQSLSPTPSLLGRSAQYALPLTGAALLSDP